MKRLITLLATSVVAIGMSGIALAQGRHGAGRPAMTGGGKPAMTGLEHAEATANANGQRGIENAEAKQAEHKDPDKDKDKSKKPKKHKKDKKAKGEEENESR